MGVSRLFRDFLFQAGGRYAGTLLQAIRAVVLAALLGPLGMGTVATVAVVLGYGMYSDLGVGEAAMRELPLAIGSGDLRRQEAWRWYAVSAKVTGALALAAGLVAYLVVAWADLPQDLRFGLATAALVVVMQQFVSGQTLVLQALHRFGHAAALNLTLPAVSLAAGVLGAWYAGVRGVFVGQVVAYAAAVVVAAAFGGLPPRRPMPGLRLRRLLRIGLPFVVLSFAFYNLVYLDQVMVVWLLGREQLGIYTLALYAGTALYMIPTAVAVSVGPRLLRRFGEVSDPAAIQEYTWRPVHVLSVVLPPLVAAVWWLGPVFIDAFLPEYSATNGPLRVYTTGIFFLGLNIGVSTTLYAFDRHRRNIPVLLAAIGLNVGLDLLLVAVFDLGLYGIALGSLVTYSCYWVAQTTLVTRTYGHGTLDGLRLLARYGWPGIVLAGALALLASAGVLGQATPLAAGVLALMCVVSAVRLRREGVLADLRAALGRQTP